MAMNVLLSPFENRSLRLARKIEGRLRRDDQNEILHDFLRASIFWLSSPPNLSPECDWIVNNGIMTRCSMSAILWLFLSAGVNNTRTELYSIRSIFLSVTHGRARLHEPSSIIILNTKSLMQRSQVMCSHQHTTNIRYICQYIIMCQITCGIDEESLSWQYLHFGILNIRRNIQRIEFNMLSQAKKILCLILLIAALLSAEASAETTATRMTVRYVHCIAWSEMK